MATLAQVTTQLGLVTSDITAIVSANGSDTTGATSVTLVQQAFADLQTAQDLLTAYMQTQAETGVAENDTTTQIDAAADLSI